MGEAAELKGADFAQGVSFTTLVEGMNLGHAQGEAVLLVRRGELLFAIGATCSHYGGPLAEGLLEGDTVRCPWHHACFSLSSGAAVRAPALNPVACWKVERRGEEVFVTGKVEVTPPRVAPASSPSSVVIVGAGAAGNAAALTLRAEGYEGKILLLGADASDPVDRPNLSKDYLAGNAPEEWIPLGSAEAFAEKKIELRTGARVQAIDPKAKTVTLADGTTHGFGGLILATGADPVRLSIPGADLPHVHTLRTLADSRAIIAGLGSAKRAVVVGASFIGLEVAASLRARGIEVHVVAPDALPLERVLGPQLGAFIQALHEAHGVRFHLGTKPAAIEARSVTLSDGSRLEAELVVMGVGVRPALALAEAAGLAVDGGVTVDAHLETSVPGIYAAGDIARWPDARTGKRVRIEHWVVAERQGELAARNLLGQKRRFEAVPFFWSQHYDVPINYVGVGQGWDQIDVAGSIEGRDCTVTYREKGAIRAVATIYRDQTSLEIEAAMERGDEARLEELVRR